MSTRATIVTGLDPARDREDGAQRGEQEQHHGQGAWRGPVRGTTAQGVAREQSDAEQHEQPGDGRGREAAALLRALESAAQAPELAGLLDSLPDLRLVRR